MAVWAASTPTGASLTSALTFTAVTPSATEISATGAVATTAVSNMGANGFMNALITVNNRTTSPATILSSFNSSSTHIKGFHMLSGPSTPNHGMTW